MRWRTEAPAHQRSLQTPLFAPPYHVDIDNLRGTLPTDRPVTLSRNDLGCLHKVHSFVGCYGLPSTLPSTVAPLEEYPDGLPSQGIHGLHSTKGNPGLSLSPTSGVTGNTLKPGGYAAPPSPVGDAGEADAVVEFAIWLDTAAPLALDSAPSTVEASTVVNAASSIVLTHQAKRRGAKLQAKLTAAIGAIVGSVLKQWGRSPPRPVFRSSQAAGFTDGPVPYRQFIAAMDGLTGAGLVMTQPGYRRATDFGFAKIWSGKAARYWPSSGLLELAAEHGVTADAIGHHFTTLPPSRPPTVREPVVVTSLKITTGRLSGQGTKQRLDTKALGPDLERVRQEVLEVNQFAAQIDVRGCLPPRWKRVFAVNSLLGGRWIAVGKEGVYQTMSEDQRPERITIDGQPVAELDVSACQLSIVHGLLGLPLPDGDPYAIRGYPRDVVKAWITASFGKGSAVTRWSRKDPKAFARNSAYDPREVGAAICHRYPFLRAPAQSLAGPAGLRRMEPIAKSETLLTHRLMNIEAEAMTLAMRSLRSEWGVLALPLHDGMLVQRTAAREAEDTLTWAFGQVAGVRVRVTVDPPLAQVDTAPEAGRS